MPIFRLNKVLGVGRGLKVFLDLQTGATRAAVPDPRQHIAKSGRAVRRQRRMLKKKEQQIRYGRRRIVNKRKTLRQQRVEIFRLTNELQAMNDLVEGNPDTSPAPSPPDGMEVGALPDFVIIGAQKCGTTHLYNLLARHPNFKPGALKEVHYFDEPRNFSKGTEWYRRLFLKPTWEDGQRSITGEKTPSYLFDPAVPERMAQVMPDAGLISLLRNPVDRAYSQYHHLVRNGRERRSFEEAIEAEQAWLTEHDEFPGERSPGVGQGRPSGLLARGVYVDQLARWQRFFDEDQMLVLRSEDFFEHTTDTLEQVQDFLGLPRRGLKARSRKMKSFYGPMDPTLRRRLEAFFEPHNRRLYDHLGRDLGW